MIKTICGQCLCCGESRSYLEDYDSYCKTCEERRRKLVLFQGTWRDGRWEDTYPR